MSKPQEGEGKVGAGEQLPWIRVASSGHIGRYDSCPKCCWGMLYRVREDKTPVAMFCGTANCERWLIETAITREAAAAPEPPRLPCPHCGTSIPERDTYCSSCAKRVYSPTTGKRWELEPPRRVGCETLGGNIVTHLESETCEVCAPESQAASPETDEEHARQCQSPTCKRREAPTARTPTAERDYAREMAKVAVAPLEGLPLRFDAALEMATSNVAARIDPILRAAEAAAEERGRDDGRLSILCNACCRALKTPESGGPKCVHCEGEKKGRADVWEEAAKTVDHYFTVYFSQSPGSKPVAQLMEVLRARAREEEFQP